MSAEKTIRMQARQKLKSNGYTKALFGLSMLAVFFMVIESVSYIENILLGIYTTTQTLDFIIKVSSRSVTILLAILLSPVVLGYFKMLYSEKDEYEMSDVAYFFKSFKLYTKSIAFIFIYLLKMALPALLCYSPLIALALINKYLLDGIVNDTALSITTVTLVVLSTVALLTYSIRYFLSIKLFCENQSSVLSYYFNTSKTIMDGHTGDVIKLTLSFTPWFLLCITVLPLIYVIPYFLQANCISGKWLHEISRNGY